MKKAAMVFAVICLSFAGEAVAQGYGRATRPSYGLGAGPYLYYQSNGSRYYGVRSGNSAFVFGSGGGYGYAARSGNAAYYRYTPPRRSVDPFAFPTVGFGR